MKVKQKYLRYFIITGGHLLPFPYNGPFSPFFINNTLSSSLRICILSAGVAYSTSPPRGPNWGLSSGRWTWVIPGPLLLRAHLSWTPQVMALYLILPPALSLQRDALRSPPPPLQSHCGVSLYFLEIESVAGIWNERNGFIRMDENV